MRELVTSYLHFALFFGNKDLAPLLIAGMILFSLLLALFYCRRAAVIAKELRRLRQYFTGNAMRNNPMLKRHWALYETTFIYDIDKRYKTTHSAHEFFDPDDVLRGVVNVRLWRFLPNALFLVGVLAVFMQFAYGLAAFDVTSPEAILDSVKNAFFSLAHGLVILGISIGLTVALNYFSRSQIARMKRCIIAMSDMLDTLFKISSMEERQIVLREYARIFTDTIRNVFTLSPQYPKQRRDETVSIARLAGETRDELRAQSLLLGNVLKESQQAELRTQEHISRLGEKMGGYIGAHLAHGIEELKRTMENGRVGSNGKNTPTEGTLGSDVAKLLKDAMAASNPEQ
jgi:hypothetical protein